jgi:plastocyanin
MLAMTRISLLLLLAAAAALAAPAAADTTLQGNVGPGFVISLDGTSGLQPGSFTIHVTDQSEFHNFHLVGPGVDKATDVTGTGDSTWDVTLANGTYRFFCDAHPTSMKGSFTVGTVATTQKLSGGVSAAGRLTFSRSATPGKASVTIHDASAKDNFHLTGPGVNKRTGIAFKGTVTWTVTLQSGTYTYRSDAHPKTKRTLTVP